MTLLAVASGCFQSASDGVARDAGPADAAVGDCSSVCFEWLPRDEAVVCTALNAGGALGCPTGFRCVADPEGPHFFDTTPKAEGICRPSTLADRGVIETVFTHRDEDPADDPDAVAVALDLRLNGARFPRVLAPPPFLTVLRAESGRWTHIVRLDHEVLAAPLRLALPPGTYLVHYQVQSDFSGLGGLPASARMGRLRVVAAGEAIVDWDLPEVRWSATLDGAPVTDAALWVASAALLYPVISPLGATPLVLERGPYDTGTRVTTPDVSALVGLDALNVAGDQTLNVALRSRPVSGTVRIDGEAPRTDGAFVRFEHAGIRGGALSFGPSTHVDLPVDPLTGRFEGRLVEGRYAYGVVMNEAGRGFPVATDASPAPVLDLAFDTVTVPGRVTYGGAPPPADLRDTRVSFIPVIEDFGGSASSEVAPDGSFEVTLTRGVRYRAFVAGTRSARVAAEGFLRSTFAAAPLGEVRVEDSATPLSFDAPTSAVSITLTENGAPVPVTAPELARGLLELRPVDDFGRWFAANTLAFPGEGPMRVEDDVPAGRYDVVFVRGRREDFAGPFGETRLGQVELVPGERLEATFDLRTVTLRGRIRPDAVGGDGFRGSVSARASNGRRREDGPSATLAPDGTFELIALPGEYDLLLGCDAGCGPPTPRSSGRLADRLALAP
ncbi:MAG: hypothetical protein AAGH15_16925 [Myxococcota bacterium]